MSRFKKLGRVGKVANTGRVGSFSVLLHFMLAAILVCSTIVLSSCSKNDEDSIEIKISYEPNDSDPINQEMLDSILRRLKADMGLVDFKDLATLAEALKSDTITVNWVGIDTARVQQIIEEGLQSMNAAVVQQLIENLQSMDTSGVQQLIEKLQSMDTSGVQQLIEKLQSLDTTGVQQIIDKLQSMDATEVQQLIEGLQSMNAAGVQQIIESLQAMNAAGTQQIIDILQSMDTAGVQQIIDKLQSIDTTGVQQIIDKLQSLDATDVQQFIESLQAMNAASVQQIIDGLQSMQNAGVQQIVDSLQSLVDSLVDKNPSTDVDNPWDFSDLWSTFQQAIDLGKLIEKIAQIQNLGEKEYSNSFDIVVNDTLTYKVTYSVEKNTVLSLTDLDKDAHRKLTIAKNGTTLLVIDTNRDLDVSRDGLQIDASYQRLCSLEFNDMKFSIIRTWRNLDFVASNFIYNKGTSEVANIMLKGENDLNLIKLLHHDVVFTGELDTSFSDGSFKLNSKVNNMNEFYLASMGLAGIGIVGSSKENCQKQTDAFNAVVTSKMLLYDVEIGSVIIEPVASDSTSNIYRPELFLQSSGGDNKIAIKKFLETFGLTFKDIIDMLIGQ